VYPRLSDQPAVHPPVLRPAVVVGVALEHTDLHQLTQPPLVNEAPHGAQHSLASARAHLPELRPGARHHRAQLLELLDGHGGGLFGEHVLAGLEAAHRVPELLVAPRRAQGHKLDVLGPDEGVEVGLHSHGRGGRTQSILEKGLGDLADRDQARAGMLTQLVDDLMAVGAIARHFERPVHVDLPEAPPTLRAA